MSEADEMLLDFGYIDTKANYHEDTGVVAVFKKTFHHKKIDLKIKITLTFMKDCYAINKFISGSLDPEVVFIDYDLHLAIHEKLKELGLIS